MDLKEIRQIIELMKRHDLSLFHLERDGMKIKLRRGVDFDTFVNAVGSSGSHTAPAPQAPAPIERVLPQTSSAEISIEPDAGPVAPSGVTIDSPMVGTFYRSSAPGEPPFVKEGDTITEGQVVAIIEAMKVMNEIKAETSGTLVRALVNDGTAVQFGTPLFELK